MKSNFGTLALFVLSSSVLARDVPANVKAFLSRIENGKCTGGQVLQDGFFSQDGDAQDFAYCQDEATQVIYIHGSGSDLANMDVDCDGLQSPRPDDRCGASTDTQSQTTFMDTVAKYSGMGSSGGGSSGGSSGGKGSGGKGSSGSNANEKRSVSGLNVKRKSGSRSKNTHQNKSKPQSSKTKSHSDPEATTTPDPEATTTPGSESTQSPSLNSTQSPPSTVGSGSPVSDLNANYIPYIVFGNDGSKSGYTTFDPTQFGVQPLSVMAVVCGNQMFYGVWGDTNGDDGPPMVGEASIALATACFGAGNINGGQAHDMNDVLYIAFPGSAADTVVQQAPWSTQNFNDFESALAPTGDKLVAKLS